MLTQQIETTHQDDRFRLAMQSSGIGMAIVDVDGRWVEVNPALERMLGYGSGELAGRTTAETTHPDDVAISREYLLGLIDGSIPVLDAQKRYLRRDGGVLRAHVNVAAMRDADGRAAYLIAQVRDITAQHEAEEALQAMNASLQQNASERFEELQASHRQQELFAYGISHDLRAPLRAIDSFAGLLAARIDGRLDDTERDYLNRIRGATGRMAELIDALLDLSRATRAELKPETVDLSLLAEWVYAELADAEPDRIADVDVQPGLHAYGDERMLKLLLRQIVHNAWKFSRDRDRVRIVVTGERRGDRIVLSVRDEGVGFDMRYADKLFQPFHRLHGPEQAAGSGIGLAVARCIVERHHGRVWGESQPGAGSVFHVELPTDETPVSESAANEGQA